MNMFDSIILTGSYARDDMRPITDELRQLEKMNDDRKDIVSFVLLEICIFMIVADLVVEQHGLPGEILGIAGLTAGVAAVVRKYLLLFNKAKPIKKAFPWVLPAVQGICLVLYFAAGTNDAIAYAVSGFLILFHIAALAIAFTGCRHGRRKQ